MKAGQFNINDYLEKLYEASGDGQLPDPEGMIIPEENQKAYQWLKKEYQKAQTEVKVEINMGGAKFEPGYDLQTDLDSVKDFKPGMFGEVKTADNEGEPKKPANLDTKKEVPNFAKGEGEKKEEKTGEKPNFSKTKAASGDIKDKEHEAGESKEKEEKEEHEAGESEEKEEKEESKKGDTEVKKIDLKTKKK
jgi:hypothetical protein